MASATSSKWAKARRRMSGLVHAAHVLKAVPHGIDSSTFLRTIAPEIRAAVPIMYKLPEPAVLSLLHHVVEHMQNPEQAESKLKQELSKLGGNSQDSVTVFTGLLFLMQAAIRNKTKVSVVEKDLGAMNVPPAVVKAFAGALRSSRFDLEDAAVDQAAGMPKLKNLRWRVDVNISSSRLRRVMRPTVIMQMTLTDGRVRTFEVPVDRFHELRYKVAKVLKEMHAIEKHPVLQLAFDLEKQKMDE